MHSEMVFLRLLLLIPVWLLLQPAPATVDTSGEPLHDSAHLVVGNGWTSAALPPVPSVLPVEGEDDAPRTVLESKCRLVFAPKRLLPGTLLSENGPGFATDPPFMRPLRC